MANGPCSPLLAFIRRLAAAPGHGELTDGELLRRFISHKEQSAFATLLQRHGPMVLGLCRGILLNEQDAEDVFQAVFLVLVRKARAIGKPASVSAWLHGVACRLALKARTAAVRRRVCERQVVPMLASDSQGEVIWRDLQPVLHQEVERLPLCYQLPVVLCYLEGKTNEEAASLLGWPKGTVQSRLSRARERLRVRLTRRGVTVGSGFLAAILTQSAAQAAVPPALAESTLQAALVFVAGAPSAGAISTQVLAHVEGLLRKKLARVKLTAALLLTFTTLGTGAGLLMQHTRTPSNAEAAFEEPRAITLDNNSRQGLPGTHSKISDKEKLQGGWVVTAAEKDGRQTDILNGRRLLFEDSQFSVSPGEEVSGIMPRAGWGGVFNLIPGQPPRIELQTKPGFNRLENTNKPENEPSGVGVLFARTNAQLLGGYTLEGKTLKIRLRGAREGEGGKELFLILQRE
jgi:RNA polymerase sigma factor (sigma-70 family)